RRVLFRSAVADLQGLREVGGDGVDADASIAELHGQRLGELGDAALERGVDRVLGNGPERLDGRDVDHAATPTPRDHPGHDVPATQEDVQQVDAVQRVPLVLGRVEEVVGVEEVVPDVVHEHVDLP